MTSNACSSFEVRDHVSRLNNIFKATNKFLIGLNIKDILLGVIINIKHKDQTLKETMDLPYMYNIKDSLHLINDLKNISIKENTRLWSFDIKDMYTNIPQQMITSVTNRALDFRHPQ
jgi:hypothetical protein